MRLDQARERARERARTALRDAPAPALPAIDQRIGEPARHRPFGRHHGLERQPQHEGARVLVLEIVADDLPARHRDAAQPSLAVGMLGEPLVDRLAPADRRVGCRIEDRLDRPRTRRSCGGRPARPSWRIWRTPRRCAPYRATASARCRRRTGHAPRPPDGCIRGRSRRARARRCAASGCPGSRRERSRTNRAEIRAASAPR